MATQHDSANGATAADTFSQRSKLPQRTNATAGTTGTIQQQNHGQEQQDLSINNEALPFPFSSADSQPSLSSALANNNPESIPPLALPVVTEVAIPCGLDSHPCAAADVPSITEPVKRMITQELCSPSFHRNNNNITETSTKKVFNWIDPSKDVLLGRVGKANLEGNRAFRSIIRQIQPFYIFAQKGIKQKIAKDIMRIIHKRGGRFLQRAHQLDDNIEERGLISVDIDDAEKVAGSNSSQRKLFYEEVSFDFALGRTAQTLREGVADLHKWMDKVRTLYQNLYVPIDYNEQTKYLLRNTLVQKMLVVFEQAPTEEHLQIYFRVALFEENRDEVIHEASWEAFRLALPKLQRKSDILDPLSLLRSMDLSDMDMLFLRAMGKKASDEENDAMLNTTSKPSSPSLPADTAPQPCNRLQADRPSSPVNSAVAALTSLGGGNTADEASNAADDIMKMNQHNTTANTDTNDEAVQKPQETSNNMHIPLQQQMHFRRSGGDASQMKKQQLRMQMLMSLKEEKERLEALSTAGNDPQTSSAPQVRQFLPMQTANSNAQSAQGLQRVIYVPLHMLQKHLDGVSFSENAASSSSPPQSQSIPTHTNLARGQQQIGMQSNVNSSPTAIHQNMEALPRKGTNTTISSAPPCNNLGQQVHGMQSNSMAPVQMMQLGSNNFVRSGLNQQNLQRFMMQQMDTNNAPPTQDQMQLLHWMQQNQLLLSSATPDGLRMLQQTNSIQVPTHPMSFGAANVQPQQGQQDQQGISMQHVRNNDAPSHSQVIPELPVSSPMINPLPCDDDTVSHNKMSYLPGQNNLAAKAASVRQKEKSKKRSVPSGLFSDETTEFEDNRKSSCKRLKKPELDFQVEEVGSSSDVLYATKPKIEEPKRKEKSKKSMKNASGLEEELALWNRRPRKEDLQLLRRQYYLAAETDDATAADSDDDCFGEKMKPIY